MHNFLHVATQFLHANPHLAGFFAFLVVFCEAMAVLGVIIPGTVTMTAVGILIGSHTIPATSTFAWAISGAILGDYLSYLLGVYFRDRLHNMWPFRKHPKWLAKGEDFFNKHGGKSVIIGRFVGPMRAMIPMVAGMLKMPQGRFILAAVPSASIWAVLYIFPGVLLGALSLELPPKLATEFLLFLMGIVVVIWFITWLLTHFLAQICRGVDYIIMKIWRLLERFRIPRLILTKLADPRHPDDHGQLTLLIAAALSFTIFLLFTAAALHHGMLTNFNEPLYHLLRSFRTKTLDRIMLVITFFGNSKNIMIICAIMALYFVWQKYWCALSYFIITMGLAVLGTAFFKHWVDYPRPGGLLNGPLSPSFPSGHTILTITMLGFLSVILSRAFKKYKGAPYVVTIVISVLVGFSRLYLGAHWLSDVAGGLFLALTIVLFVTVFYRLSAQENLHLGQTLTAIILAALLSWSGYSMFHFQKDLFNYQILWPTKTITLTNWQTQLKSNIDMPLYRVNRLGHPIEALNIEWVSNLDDIEQNLVNQGWESYPSGFNLTGIVQRLTAHPIQQRLPMLSQLYNNHPEALLLVMSDEKGLPHLLLRLWQSDIKVDGASNPLWLGTITYYQKPKLISFHDYQKKFVSSISDFTQYLKDFTWTTIKYQQTKIPSEMNKLEWDGTMLLVKLDKKLNYDNGPSSKIKQLLPTISKSFKEFQLK